MPVALTVFVLSVVICALAHVAIVRSVLRAHSAVVDPGVRRPPKLVVEIVWALIPAVALAVVLVVTWPHVRANAMRAYSPSAKVVP